MDKILIEELKIYANHGVFENEKKEGQNFYVTAELSVPLQKAGFSDDLSSTINYADVCRFIVEYTTMNTFDLIERLAEGIATELLNEYKAIQAISLEVRKPEAPVKAHFGSLSVKIERARHKVYIAYGSNMGDSEKYIADARLAIDESPYCKLINESESYRTTPYGKVDQPDFVNGVFEVETYLEPENLLDMLHDIEHAAGRERKEHWGPRTLDLDIILYDNLIMDTEYLIIPHPDMANRDFVMRPLSELAAYLRHPITGRTIKEMADCIQEKYII